MQSSLITPRCSPVTLHELQLSERGCVVCNIPNDQLNIQLLAIALDQLPKAKPLRRSQLARRDYIPEPVVLPPEPKKNRLKGFGRLVRPAALIILGAAGGAGCDGAWALPGPPTASF